MRRKFAALSDVVAIRRWLLWFLVWLSIVFPFGALANLVGALNDHHWMGVVWWAVALLGNILYMFFVIRFAIKAPALVIVQTPAYADDETPPAQEPTRVYGEVRRWGA